MNTSISQRDIETLSAYLDGALEPNRKRKLETRLAGDPRLRAALEDLRNTRRALRHAPRLRAPRNFTLTPEMAGLKQRTSRLIPAMRFVSVAASFLFVITVASDFMKNSQFAFGFAAAAEMPATEYLAVGAEEAAAEDAPMEEESARLLQPTMVSPAPQAEALMESEEQQEMMDGVAAEEPAEAAPSMTMPQDSGETNQPSYEGEFEPSADQITGGGGGMGTGQTIQPTILAPALPTTQAFGEPLEKRGPVTATEDEIAEVEENIPARQTNWLRIIEITTAILAVSSAASVSIIKRRSG